MESDVPEEKRAKTRSGRSGGSPQVRQRRIVRWYWPVGVAACAALAAIWLGSRAAIIQTELESAAALLPQLQSQLLSSNATDASSTVEILNGHTSAARAAADDPLWTMSTALPWIGPNFQTVREVATSADDVAKLAATPLVSVFSALDWATLMPTGGGVDVTSLSDARSSLVSAAHAVKASSNRLNEIDADRLFPQVSAPLVQARTQLGSLTHTLDAAANVSTIAPDMLGLETPQHYLLIIQNNAEARASGGIPGALAVLTVEEGKLSLGAQSSAGEIGTISPVIPVDAEQRQIYTARMGKFMQDVNLTPDFPTAASTAQAMWETRSGQHVDGVVSIDPVALSYLLEATGPVQIASPEVQALSAGKLPSELTSQNVVKTLLSDVYSEIKESKYQDAYFAAVAQQVFASLSNGSTDAKALLDGVTRGAREGRVLVWSGNPSQQNILAKYPLSGSIAGPSISPAQFGVYFNDGTGAKMDYYVKRTVQLLKECVRDGYEQTTVRVTSTNTAPADAAASLPAYVTGDSIFGVPAGSVQTNIVAYGPVQANVEIAKLDGQKTEFAPYIHSNRPVAVLAVRLAPGESRTVEFTFGKIVQHTEPNLVVTPTVQDVKDVILPTQKAHCGEGS